MLSNQIRFVSLALACTVLSACGGDDAASGPAIPSDAITMNSTNAPDVISVALDELDSVFDYKTNAQATSTSGLSGLFSSFVVTKRSTPVIQHATEVTNCPGGGSTSETYTVNGNTATGTFTETDCNENDGYITNGSGSFSYTESETVYSGNSRGNIAVHEISSGDDFNFNNFVVSYTGSYITPYTTTNNITYVLTGVNGFGGFLFQTPTTIVSDDNHCSPYQGVIMISGANKTRLRITFMQSNQYELSLDTGTGTFTTQGTFDRDRCVQR